MGIYWVGKSAKGIVRNINELFLIMNPSLENRQKIGILFNKFAKNGYTLRNLMKFGSSIGVVMLDMPDNFFLAALNQGDRPWKIGIK